MFGLHFIDDDSFAVVRNELNGTIKVVNGGGNLWVNPFRESLLFKSTRIIDAAIVNEPLNRLGALEVKTGDGSVFIAIKGSLRLSVLPGSEEVVATQRSAALKTLNATVATSVVGQPCCTATERNSPVLTPEEILTCQSQALADTLATAQNLGFDLLSVDLNRVSLWTPEAFKALLEKAAEDESNDDDDSGPDDDGTMTVIIACLAAG